MKRGIGLGALLLAIGLGYLALSGTGPKSDLTRFNRAPRLGSRAWSMLNQLTSLPPAFASNFAPLSGAGMGTVCACQNITTAEGAPLTVTRASTGYCTRGNTKQNIQPGDLVLCGNDKPRVMPNGDGTGPLKYLSERQGINTMMSSEAFASGDWAPATAGAAAAIVSNPDAGLAPNGSNSATRIIFDATSGTGASGRYQNPSCGNPGTFTIYVRGHDAACATPIDLASVLFESVPCQVDAFDAGWKRCEHDGYNAAYAAIGNLSNWNGGVARSACDALVWGSDCKNEAAPSSYVPTPVGSTATRLVDIATFPLLSAQRTDRLMSAVVIPNGTLTLTDATIASMETGFTSSDATTYNRMTLAGAASGAGFYKESAGGASSSLTNSAVATPNVHNTVSAYDNGDLWQSQTTNGTTVDGGVQVYGGELYQVCVGCYWNGFNFVEQPNAAIGQLTISSAARRDIYLFGDSTTEGNTAGAGHQPQFIIHRQLGNAVAINNHGTSGFTIDQIQTAWETELTQLAAGGNPQRAYFMAQGGINSQYDDGGTSGGVTNVVNKLRLMLHEARDAGVNVLWSTVLPDCAGGSASVAFVDSVNSQMTTWVTANGYTMANPFRLVEFPTDSGCFNPAMSVDGVHENDAGMNIVTQEWIRAGGWPAGVNNLCLSVPPGCTSGDTNTLKHSEAFTSADWTKTQTGGGPNAVTVTDNFAVGPDCEKTNAARLQVPAQGTSSFSMLTQVQAAGTHSCGLYVKGNTGTSGNLHLWITSTGVNACVTCAFTGDWSLCEQLNTAIGSGNLYVGSDPMDCGGGATDAVDVLIADAQCQSGATLNGYIATTTAAASCP